MNIKLIMLLSILFIGTVSAGAGSTIGAVLAGIFCDLATAVIDIAGVIASLILVWAGVKWIYSADNPDERNKAREILINVLIGLIIIMIAKGVVSVLLEGRGAC